MSGSTICHGCGQRLHVPADYRRAKMRCPECGVICDVPPPEERPAPAKPAKRRTEPVAAPHPSPPPPEPAPAMENLPIPLAPDPEPPPRTSELDYSDDPEDSKPYRTADEPALRCPHCNRILEPGSVRCAGCGCELRTGKKPKRSYEPVELSWEAGMPLRRRRLLFILGIVLGIGLGVPISIAGESWTGGIISWVVFIVLSAFLLGTYPRVELQRSRRGKVALTKTWRMCFLQRPPIQFDVLEFQAVRTGYARDVSAIDWMIAILLLPFGLLLGLLWSDWVLGLILLPVGLIPSIFWWYIFIQRDQHTVTLVREHGYGSDVLYRGVSEDMANDMAGALDEIAGLPHENG